MLRAACPAGGRAGLERGPAVVAHAARTPANGNSGRSARLPAPRAVQDASTAQPTAPTAAAPPPAAAPVGAAAVPLPSTLQGAVVMPDTHQQQSKQAGKTAERDGPSTNGKGPAPGSASAGVKGKRPDKRRRLLAKQRAEKALAAAASATAAPEAAAVGVDQQQQQKEMGQQQRRRRGPGGNDKLSSGKRGGEGLARERQIPITPKDQDLKRWYADATAAAEQAFQSAKAAGAGSRRGGRVAGAATFAQAFQGPMQEWLDERLEYMGFAARQFPALQPLPAILAAAQREQQQRRRRRRGKQEDGQEGGEEQRQEQREAAAVGTSSSKQQRRGAAFRGCTATAFARWASSEGGELPLLAAQWHGGPPGWELRPAQNGQARRLLEAHAAHEWAGASEEHARAMMGMCEEFALEAAGLPVVAGRAPARATLPGAAASYTLQALVADGRALQVASAHDLADNYSRALLLGELPGQEQQQQDEEQQEQAQQEADGRRQQGEWRPQQGEWGDEPPLFAQMGASIESQLLGGMALAHGDDAGLRLPPALAPVQVLIVPVLHYRCDRGAMAAEAERLRSALEAAGVRVAVDWRRRGPAGVRFGDSERMGVPLRIELGPRDLKARTCTIAQRHLPGQAGKLADVSTDADALVDTVRDLLEEQQSEARWGAASALQEHIVDVSSFYELREVVEAGKWARGPWAGSLQDEAAVFDEAGASLRCFPLAQPASMWGGFQTCLYSGYQATEVAIFARGL